MIDTIRLRFDEGYAIVKPSFFKPNADLMLKPDFAMKNVRKAVLNPSKIEKKLGQYGPRLTLYRSYKPTAMPVLIIEVSLPKLLFGNNLDELTEEHFDQVLDTLHQWLKNHGVLIFKEILANAPVSAIHFGKNIVLPRFVRCASIIRSLSKVPAHGWQDVVNVDYRLDGHLYKTHTNTTEFVVYDKLKDYDKHKKSPKRSYCDDYDIQHELWEGLSQNRQAELLRLELRLNTPSVIRKTLERAGLDGEDLRFKSLFNPQIAQQCLQVWWQPYRTALPPILWAEKASPDSMFETLRYNCPDAPLESHIKDLGLLMLVGAIGWTGAEAYYRMDSTMRTCQAHKKRLQAITPRTDGLMEPVRLVDDALAQFEPLRASDVLTVSCEGIN
jgi:hypothetical protein